MTDLISANKLTRCEEKITERLLIKFSCFLTVGGDRRLCYSAMESIEKNLQDPKLIEKLLKTGQGRAIAAKIISFVDELEKLPDSVKIKIRDEYGSRFEDTLSKLDNINNQTANEEHSIPSGTNIVMVFVIIIAFAGISPKH